MLDVIYDGQCGFCVRSLNVCRMLDIRSAFRYHDANVRDQVLQAFPELVHADFENAMFVVEPGRRVTRGFFAFRRMIWESPLLWPLLVLFYFPGSGMIGPKIYAWIAANRRSFGCESEVCELPQVPPAGRDPVD